MPIFSLNGDKESTPDPWSFDAEVLSLVCQPRLVQSRLATSDVPLRRHLQHSVQEYFLQGDDQHALG